MLQNHKLSQRSYINQKIKHCSEILILTKTVPKSLYLPKLSRNLHINQNCPETLILTKKSLYKPKLPQNSYINRNRPATVVLTKLSRDPHINENFPEIVILTQQFWDLLLLD